MITTQPRRKTKFYAKSNLLAILMCGWFCFLPPPSRVKARTERKPPLIPAVTSAEAKPRRPMRAAVQILAGAHVSFSYGSHPPRSPKSAARTEYVRHNAKTRSAADGHGRQPKSKLNAIFLHIVDAFSLSSKAKLARVFRLFLRAPGLLPSIDRHRCCEPAKTPPQVRHGAIFSSTLFATRNMAAELEVLDAVPRIKLSRDKDRPQQRSVDALEYQLILANMHRREQQRCIVGWWESSMRHQELFALKWSMVDLRAGLLRLPAEILKERSPRRTPISYELRVVLEELNLSSRRLATSLHMCSLAKTVNRSKTSPAP